MLSRVEWVKRTVTWMNRPHSTQVLSSGEGTGDAADMGLSVAAPGWSPKNENLANFSEIGGPQESDLCPARTDSWCPLSFDLAISEAGDMRFGQEE